MAARVRHDYAAGSVVDTRLPAAPVGGDVAEAIRQRWPRYDSLSFEERGCYLDWLAGERNDPETHACYVLLYFFGLEYRFFIDGASRNEKQMLLEEVVRLFDLYRNDEHLADCLGEFIDVALLVLGSAASLEPIRSYYQGMWLPVLSWRYAIGSRISKGMPLSGELLLSWHLAESHKALRPQIVRIFDEFRVLIDLLIPEDFDYEALVDHSELRMYHSYHAASANFIIDLSKYLRGIPDSDELLDLRLYANSLVNVACEILAPYSRYLSRRPDSRGSLEAHLKIPYEFWDRIPCDAVARLRWWAEDMLDSDPSVSASALIEQAFGTKPTGRIYKKQLVVAADALARFSIGMAPDARFATRRPKVGEQVLLFCLSTPSLELDRVSDEYKKELVTVTIGSIVARADGTVSVKERSELHALVRDCNLSGDERSMLRANLMWMLFYDTRISSMRQRLKNSPEQLQTYWAEVAVAVALADGRVVPKEAQVVLSLCKAAGLNTDFYLQKLGPVTAPVVAGPGPSAPRQPGARRKVALDLNRIAALTEETREVADVLGAVFLDEEAAMQPAAEISGQLPGLDAAYAGFLQTLTGKLQWKRSDLEAVAKQYKLMTEGALEAVNDWSSDLFSELLIDDEEEYYEVNTYVVEQIAQLESV